MLQDNSWGIMIHKLNLNDNGNNFFIKREDLIPFSFGGNKVRIGEKFIEDALDKKCDVIISYGSSKSNLNRAMISLCKEKNIQCYIVSPVDIFEKELNFNKKLNFLNIKNENIYKCKKEEVAITINNLMTKLKNEGKNPYYINGNIYGKGNEKTAVKAYRECYKEIIKYEEENNIHFDYVFLAVGTGMTYSGLVLEKIISKTENKKIIGISIARKKEQGIESIKRYLQSELKEEEIKNNEIYFIDDYLAGGYGNYNEEIKNIIIKTYQNEGIPLDTTYTGKSFYGMIKYLEKNKIKRKNILFIHTGGTPLFFDNMKEWYK